MQLALYRECRPRTFHDIVAQEHVTRTLLNAIAQGRLAHAYLFCGPRGTGKTSTARVLAKALNCPTPVEGEPCGHCEACEAIARGEGVDVIEMDAASNRGIDEIRNLRERVRLSPVAGRYKVYVIDEVHMLTNEAFNALLKTLEEPPSNVVFVLCTTESYRVPATILSRCQRFDFHRLPTPAIARHLAQIASERGWDVREPALAAIARAATGSMRDALGILDQCMAYSTGSVDLGDVRRVLGAVDPASLAALAEPVLLGDLAAAWQALDELLSQGRDAREVSRALAGHFRDVLLYRLAGTAGEPTGPLADDPEVIASCAALASEKTLYEAIDALATVEADMRLAPQPRLLLESRLVRLCSHQGDNQRAPVAGVDSPKRPRTQPPNNRPARAQPVKASHPSTPSSHADSVTSDPVPVGGEAAGGPGRGDKSVTVDSLPAPTAAGQPPASPLQQDEAPPTAAEIAIEWASPADDVTQPLESEPTWPDDSQAPPEYLFEDEVEQSEVGRLSKGHQPGPRQVAPVASIAEAAAANPPAQSSKRELTSVQRVEEFQLQDGGSGAEPDEALLDRAWQAALGCLSDKDRGWLDGASPGWENHCFCAWLPAGREDLAAFLDGKDICRELSRGLGQVLGYEPEVRVRSRGPGPGLFGEELGPASPARPSRGTRAGSLTPRPGSGSGDQTGGGGAADDTLRHAQEMFGAEEVGKGVELD